ncbi:MFS transporter [Thiopseudomonas alkaliphila]|uniref:MFS transporter n=1 Tax=Thiopseudomonas alkaliphila TaxID=1697053 RepID=UPI00069E9AFF|nr:MFS transporter [Thiopseudomonas alkaliphila]AKX46291.1 MFS transporter [Thiopseudomonas alkaliphila]AKX49360.1 MFS transporter [Thiopseudomonas alkaliphila]AKX52730.1 MFS transporter [Thiopseudomonas alkaliphila]
MHSALRTGLLLMIGSSIILALSLGIRHAFGLYLNPLSQAFGWEREIFSFAIAVQNLVWGGVQPFVGAFADRYGLKPTVIVTTLAYACGLYLMANSSTPMDLTLSAGLLIGFGLSGTSFAVLLSAIGRSVPAEKRSMAMGIASAAGSLGQFVMLPGTLGLIEWLGWSSAMLVTAALICLCLPLAFMLKETPLPSTAHEAQQSIKQALNEVMQEKGFWLLAFGFFVCGFQVVFIGVHIPSYLIDRQLPASVGTTVLALVGLFNIIGTWLAGWLGGYYSKPKLLGWLYLIRGLVIALFFYLPISQLSAYLFGIAMGLLWLSTVPLTNGTVASMFGIRNLSMLAGIVFFFHQVGSFLGGWLGGLVFDRTGSYDLVWQLSIALSVVAALCNFPIKEFRVPKGEPIHAITS